MLAPAAQRKDNKMLGMQESQQSDILSRYGFASDGTVVYVEQSAYDEAPVEERENPDWWMEQVATNDAVWTGYRPQVEPVYGTCGHIARNEKYTCGAYFCVQMFAY